MNILIKIAACILLLIAYFVLACLIIILPATGRVRHAIRIRIASFFSRRALAVLGVRVRADRRVGQDPDHGGLLIVSNHLSSLDILIISSILPSVFITSVELRESFLLGALARLGGCLFVERRNPAGLKRE